MAKTRMISAWTIRHLHRRHLLFGRHLTANHFHFLSNSSLTNMHGQEQHRILNVLNRTVD
jgi:hypothetical protein